MSTVVYECESAAFLVAGRFFKNRPVPESWKRRPIAKGGRVIQPHRPARILVVPRNRISKIEPNMCFPSLGIYGLVMGLP